MRIGLALSATSLKHGRQVPIATVPSSVFPWMLSCPESLPRSLVNRLNVLEKAHVCCIAVVFRIEGFFVEPNQENCQIRKGRSPSSAPRCSLPCRSQHILGGQ